MTDDFLAGGILPTNDVSGDVDFDPNAVDSDAFLDDPKEDILADVPFVEDEDDELLDDE